MQYNLLEVDRVSRASRTGVISGMTRGKIWDYVFAQRIRREREEGEERHYLIFV